MKPLPSLLDETVREVWGLQCPACKSDEHLEIELVCWAALSADGTNTDAANDGNHYWDENSACRCDACNAIGTVKGFNVPEEDGAQ